MKQEIFINVLPFETRSAVMEEGHVVELQIERQSSLETVGRIYKGRIKRVMRGMQAAFVEYGELRTGFLHIKDLAEFKAHEEDYLNQNWVDKDISDYVKEGAECFVQVHKNAIGTKGARLTTQLSIVSHYLVMIPEQPHIGVSLRITDPLERERLLSMFPQEAHAGFIFRTSAEGISPEAILQDKAFLEMRLQALKEKMPSASVGECVQQELPLYLRVLRDVAHASCAAIYVDAQAILQEMQSFAARYIPALQNALRYYAGTVPLFEQFHIEKSIIRALQREVPLPCGGYLVIDQAEAMTVIDVNSGSYVGHTNLEETAFKINMSAVAVIVWQLRLRNVGGMIVIDFIDMLVEDHHLQLLAALREALAKDTAKSQLFAVTRLGLVEMTRKRVRESLQQMLCDDCPTCQGVGFIRTPESIAHEICRALLKNSVSDVARPCIVSASPQVVDWLQHHEPDLCSLQHVRLQVNALYHPEKFQIGYES